MMLVAFQDKNGRVHALNEDVLHVFKTSKVSKKYDLKILGEVKRTLQSHEIETLKTCQKFVNDSEFDYIAQGWTISGYNDKQEKIKHATMIDELQNGTLGILSKPLPSATGKILSDMNQNFLQPVEDKGQNKVSSKELNRLAALEKRQDVKQEGLGLLVSNLDKKALRGATEQTLF